MEAGAFTSGLITGLREGVEATLIVAIILAYLAKTGKARHFPRIWLGAGAAIALSVLVGALLVLTVGELPEPYEQIFEGVVMVLAAGVVTWMLFWMRGQAATVGAELRSAVDRALTDQTGILGLVVLAFTAVIREGIETSLFLVGQLRAASGQGDIGALSVLVGALIGLSIAVALGYGFYRGSRRLDLRTFFRATGVLLVFIAAGLLSHAVHEFVEIGWIPFGTQTAFDISSVLPDDAGMGVFLRALFGYSASPELITLFVHVGYIATVLPLFLRPVHPGVARRPEPQIAGRL